MINTFCWGMAALIVGLAWFESESKNKRYFARIFIAFVIFTSVLNFMAALGGLR